jgi:hypothetical protein
LGLSTKALLPKHARTFFRSRSFRFLRVIVRHACLPGFDVVINRTLYNAGPQGKGKPVFLDTYCHSCTFSAHWRLSHEKVSGLVMINSGSWSFKLQEPNSKLQTPVCRNSAERGSRVVVRKFKAFKTSFAQVIDTIHHSRNPSTTLASEVVLLQIALTWRLFFSTSRELSR